MAPKATTSSTNKAKIPQRAGQGSQQAAGKHKPQKKQPPSTTDRLKRLFTSLCAQIDGGHFTNALKTCDKILRLQPNDADAMQTKLFLLLQTEQYDTALSLIGSGNGHDFESTYSLYRLQREADAEAGLKTLKATHDGQDEDSQEARGVLHLEAQLNYRKGSYQTAFDLYNQLLDTAESNSEEHSDILTNLQASQSHLEFIESTYLRSLSALPTAITSSLETNPPPAAPTAPSAAAIAVAAAASGPQDAKADGISKPKKARPSRVPKGVTPGVTPAPDPERWLKKSERSTFGQGIGKKRRGGGGGGGASQGAAVVDAPSSGAGAGAKSGGKKKGKK